MHFPDESYDEEDAPEIMKTVTTNSSEYQTRKITVSQTQL
jgi:hypothetical protein